MARKTAKATTGWPLKRGEGARLLDGVGRPRRGRQPDLAAARQHDRGLADPRTRAGAGERADRLLLAAELAAAAGEVDVGGAQLPVDVGRGDAERHQPVGIERDADLAVDAADRGRRGRRPSGPEAARLTTSSTNQDSCSGVIARRRRRVGQDRLAFDIDALDDRLVDGARQVGADLGDGVLDVVERAVGVDLEPELDRRRRRASVMVEVTCLTPVMLATASSTFLVTWSRARPARRPDCVTVTETTGTSMLGNRVIGSLAEAHQPERDQHEEQQGAGTGWRIDQAEMFSVMARSLRSWPRRARACTRSPIAQESAGARDEFGALDDPGKDFDLTLRTGAPSVTATLLTLPFSTTWRNGASPWKVTAEAGTARPGAPQRLRSRRGRSCRRGRGRWPVLAELDAEGAELGLLVDLGRDAPDRAFDRVAAGPGTGRWPSCRV